MKKQAQFLARQAAMFDRSAAKLFQLTRLTVSLMLMVSLGLLIAEPYFSSASALFQLSDGLFHAAFRIAAVGVAAGFAADIMAKRSRK